MNLNTAGWFYQIYFPLPLRGNLAVKWIYWLLHKGVQREKNQTKSGVCTRMYRGTHVCQQYFTFEGVQIPICTTTQLVNIMCIHLGNWYFRGRNPMELLFSELSYGEENKYLHPKL